MEYFLLLGGEEVGLYVWEDAENVTNRTVKAPPKTGPNARFVPFLAALFTVRFVTPRKYANSDDAYRDRRAVSL